MRGWAEGSGRDLLDVAREFADAGVEAFVVTQIGRDGTLTGPDLDGLAEVLAATDLPVVASGGVGTLDDLRALDALTSTGRHLAGAIVGPGAVRGVLHAARGAGRRRLLTGRGGCAPRTLP